MGQVVYSLGDVLFAGQWEGGQMELHKDEFDILAVIKFLSWGLKDLLEQKEIAFNMNIDEFASKLLTDHRVIGDKQRVVQTLGEFEGASFVVWMVVVLIASSTRW